MKNFTIFFLVIEVLGCFIGHAMTDSSLEQKCLKELEPFKACDIGIYSLKFNEEEAKSKCELYDQMNCREFFKSPFTFAPSCEGIEDKSLIPLINLYESFENPDTEWEIAVRNLYCARKNENEFCGLFEKAMLLFYNNKNMDLAMAKSCRYEQCRESLLNYFNSFIQRGYCGSDEQKLNEYQERIDYLTSKDCIITC